MAVPNIIIQYLNYVRPVQYNTHIKFEGIPGDNMGERALWQPILKVVSMARKNSIWPLPLLPVVAWELNSWLLYGQPLRI